MSLVTAIRAVAVAALGADDQEKKGKNVLHIGEVKVEGRVQRPHAFYVLSRHHPRIEDTLARPETFIPRILRSVEEEPF